MRVILRTETGLANQGFQQLWRPCYAYGGYSLSNEFLHKISR